MDGDAFYEFAETFAAEFCDTLNPPPPGPRGYVEICPPDLAVAEWKAIARARSWPPEFWMVA